VSSSKFFISCGLVGEGASVQLAKQAWRDDLTRATGTRYLQAVIACVDGTILVATGGLDLGAYRMHREGGSHSSCVRPGASFEQVCEDMVAHAWGSYGGVRWMSGVPGSAAEAGHARAVADELARARFWLEAARTGVHPGHERSQVLAEADRYKHLDAGIGASEAGSK